MEEAAIRLLIVDDNPELCDILENYFNLTSEITVCGVARDGEEALFRIAQSQPDVVLLDLIMPKLDGKKNARNGKKCPFRNIWIIIWIRGFRKKKQ